MTYFCCDERRRNSVAAHAVLNGIDYLEVLDHQAPAGFPRQQTLLVHCLKPLGALGRANVRIEGGERIRAIGVPWAAPAAAVAAPPATAPEVAFFTALPGADRILVVRTDSAGDHSRYRLSLVTSPEDAAPPPTFDPMLASVELSFKVECESAFDCAVPQSCPPDTLPAPDIDYLAKDYASFRRLILDRLSQLLPGWRERNPADLGVVLAELLAYVGDHLSYEQDAVGTEAYLGTARRRVSVRRHALLVDYAMHDGCNARAWVALTTTGDGVRVTRDSVSFLTRVEGLGPRLAPASPERHQALERGALVFEPLFEDDAGALTLYTAHNEIEFHTWGDERCCLPAKAMRATLRGHLPRLGAGDVLIFEEVVGPLTGATGDADPTHRHAVRLTEVVHTSGNAPLLDPLTGEQITQIAWGEADALASPLCISAVTDRAHGERVIQKVSVARGNVLLVDHGQTVVESATPGKPFLTVPAPRLVRPPASDATPCAPRTPTPLPVRFRPALAWTPVTQQGTFARRTSAGGVARTLHVPVDTTRPAADAFAWSMSDVQPCVVLASRRDEAGAFVDPWHPVRDLLASDRRAQDFVVEVEGDGVTRLRFGDDQHGARPRRGTQFRATYRTGNGSAGNVGAEAVAHVVTDDTRITAARNPLPAAGGLEPESIPEVRRRAPQAFRRLERAVTRDDYVEIARRFPHIQNAAATMRWTGSWHTVFVTVDRLGGVPLAGIDGRDRFKDDLIRHLDRYRMAGSDVALDEPRHVSLEIELFVCVKPDYFRSDVKLALLQVLGSRRLADGRLGLFHPDKLTFGGTIYLSPIYAAAHTVAGVESVRVTIFQRQGVPDPRPLEAGRLELSRLEIARCDNDPSFPEHGVLNVFASGGK